MQCYCLLFKPWLRRVICSIISVNETRRVFKYCVFAEHSIKLICPLFILDIRVHIRTLYILLLVNNLDTVERR